MAAYRHRSGIAIGEVLKSTRTRQGLDIREVEERTKIRTRYLRALEGEDWDVLPSPAYAKGFLRTYAQLLGLDADALVDEFRRQVEGSARTRYPVSERVLDRRRRAGGPSRGPGLWALAATGALVAAAVLLALGLAGEGDDGGGGPDRAERREARQERLRERRQRRQRRQAARGGDVRLRLVMEDDVAVCLVGDGARPLIAGQVVAAGSEEQFTARRFLLAFPSGYDADQLRVVINGERERLPGATGPSAYRVVPPGRLRELPDPGRRCP